MKKQSKNLKSKFIKDRSFQFVKVKKRAQKQIEEIDSQFEIYENGRYFLV